MLFQLGNYLEHIRLAKAISLGGPHLLNKPYLGRKLTINVLINIESRHANQTLSIQTYPLAHKKLNLKSNLNIVFTPCCTDKPISTEPRNFIFSFLWKWTMDKINKLMFRYEKMHVLQPFPVFLNTRLVFLNLSYFKVQVLFFTFFAAPKPLTRFAKLWHLTSTLAYNKTQHKFHTLKNLACKTIYLVIIN